MVANGSNIKATMLPTCPKFCITAYGARLDLISVGTERTSAPYFLTASEDTTKFIATLDKVTSKTSMPVCWENRVKILSVISNTHDMFMNTTAMR